ncbi:Fic family protein [Bdellovibrionota bacterium FG-1]
MPSDRTQLAKKWWAKNVNKRPVWRTADLPEPWFKDMLVLLKLAYEVRRDTLVLGKPETELPTLIRSYFWEIVSCVLKPYIPYTITGITAVHSYLGSESIPKELDVLTQSSSTRIDLHGISLLVLEKNPAFFQRNPIDSRVKSIKTNKNYELAVESPESLLVRLRPQILRDYPQVMSAFLKAIDFKSEALRTLLLQESRPIVYARLAALFEQIGKNAESKLIRSTVKITTHYSSPGKSQILKYPLPATVASSRRISDSVYVTRFRDQLRIYRDRVDAELKDVKLSHWGLKNILAYAEQRKKQDTYHSSTIEGYGVTQEEIQALIEGRAITTTGASHEEIERKMALKGYLEAHKFVLRTIADHFKNGNPVTEVIIREIYAHLFLPSLEAGLVTQEQLTRYRNDAVYSQNSRYVPPNHQKVDNLMRCMVEEVNEVENKATRALLVHYGFVTVHPYFDGNGRVARLLMNYVLSLGGIPWITIRIEDRDKYFQALEVAQCDENIGPFTGFLKRYFKEKATTNDDKQGVPA